MSNVVYDPDTRPQTFEESWTGNPRREIMEEESSREESPRGIIEEEEEEAWGGNQLKIES